MNQLPIHLVEAGLGESTDIRAITTSMCFCPYIYGFSCENVTIHDVVRAVAGIVVMNPHLELIRLVRVGADDGCKELATAMYENPDSSVVYWDLSENKLDDISHLMQAFRIYAVRVRSFRFTNCRMDAFEVQLFLQSLIANSCLHELEHLCIAGNGLGDGHCRQLSDFLALASSLTVLEFGPASRVEMVLSAIKQPLEALRIHNSALWDGSIATFVGTSTTLRRLDLSGCDLPEKAFTVLLETIRDNAQLSEIRLKFNRMYLSGSRLAAVFESFRVDAGLRQKVTEISLGTNGLGLVDCQFLVPILQAMPNLRKVSLSGNFGERMTGIGAEIAGLLRVSHIEALILRGCHLGEQARDILNALFNNDTLHEIDLTNNEIRGWGIALVTNLLRTNPSLKIVAIDGSKPENLQCILNFLDVVGQSNTLIQVPYPINDIYERLGNLPEEQRLRSYDVLTHLQGRAEERLAKNRAAVGLFSALALLQDDVLNSWFDAITLEMHEKLARVPVAEHRAITQVVGLPFPYEDERAPSGPVVSSPDDAGSEPYVSHQMMAVVEDPLQNDDLRTLQFNSLIIRRPDAEERLRQKGQIYVNSPRDPSEFEAPPVQEGE
jgi:Ran GTPase-activating protein (RanGAP) involved in mRNA processing and transport